MSDFSRHAPAVASQAAERWEGAMSAGQVKATAVADLNCLSGEGDLYDRFQEQPTFRCQ